MTTFLSKAACHGRNPLRVSSSRYFSRNDLLSALLKDRHVARFLVAPPCFGKTSLISEYAQSIFLFQNVYWINGQSSCFLRDLDACIIVEEITGKNDKLGLVVFEDVPLLDTQRAQLFSEVIDSFLERGWEVIISVSPLCDVYQELQSDRLIIDAHEFLISDGELALWEVDSPFNRTDMLDVSVADRVPGIFWNEKSEKELLKLLIKEDISADYLLAIFAFLVLGKGDIANVGSCVKPWNDSMISHFKTHYHYVGIDSCTDEFEAHLFSIEAISEVFGSKLEKLVTSSTFFDKDELIAHLATLLLDRYPERACSCMSTMSSVTQRMNWLAENAKELFEKACFYDAHMVYESIKVPRTTLGTTLQAAEAWRLLYLGRLKEALRLAGRVAQSAYADSASSIMASLLMAREGNEAGKKQAHDTLSAILHYVPECTADINDVDLRRLEGSNESLKVLSTGFLCLCKAPTVGFDFIRACNNLGLGLDVATFFLGWIVADVSQKLEADEYEPDKRKNYEEIISYSYMHFEQTVWNDTLTFPDVLLYEKLESVLPKYLSQAQYSFSSALLTHIKAIELKVVTQKMKLEGDGMHIPSKDKKKLPQTVTSIASLPKQNEEREIIPQLYVRLLGGLEVTIGGRIVDPLLFRRRKVKALLALLVVNHGKELSCDMLSKVLWPDSSYEAARKNLYSVWSMLKKALEIAPNKCPYLIRFQHSCKIDSHYVSSDVSEINNLCRTLLFGIPDAGTWQSIYGRILELYTDDILPCETENEAIIQARKDYRSRLVDAFVAAAHQLIDAKETVPALWFARSAVSRDETREDAYAALMRAQIEAGQRATALETYFTCRKFLTEELGIDPSVKTVMLYERIIQEDPTLKRLECE